MLRKLLASLIGIATVAGVAPSRVLGDGPPALPSAPLGRPLRIMPVGDSITRGSYLGAEKRPNPLGGGWRKPLQDRLKMAAVDFEFVGDVDYWAFGANGVTDPTFSPCHHGLAGFSNTAILRGGVVPTPKEVLAAKGVEEIRVPGIADALARHKPDIVLLMSGANGFDAKARSLLIRTILEHLNGALLVASITPQKPPRKGWEQVLSYNASLPSEIAALRAAGAQIHYVDMYAALTPEDICDDGVHPAARGLRKMADTWFDALMAWGVEARRGER